MRKMMLTQCPSVKWECAIDREALYLIYDMQKESHSEVCVCASITGHIKNQHTLQV